jgi:hypothetical protein
LSAFSHLHENEALPFQLQVLTRKANFTNPAGDHRRVRDTPRKPKTHTQLSSDPTHIDPSFLITLIFSSQIQLTKTETKQNPSRTTLSLILPLKCVVLQNAKQEISRSSDIHM